MRGYGLIFGFRRKAGEKGAIPFGDQAFVQPLYQLRGDGGIIFRFFLDHGADQDFAPCVEFAIRFGFAGLETGESLRRLFLGCLQLLDLLFNGAFLGLHNPLV